MEKLIKEIEDDFRVFIENEIDAREPFDISKYGNPNVRPPDKITWINVQREKDRLIAEHKNVIGEKKLKGKLEHVISQLSSWF